jgi:phage-related protein
MAIKPTPLDVHWVGRSKKDLSSFPEDVKYMIGHALHEAQTGGKHESAKPMQGFGGAGVLEVVEDYKGDTYRAVYTVKFKNAVYVLHAFQKKANQGNKTSQNDINLIKSNLKIAEADSKAELAAKAKVNQGVRK